MNVLEGGENFYVIVGASAGVRRPKRPGGCLPLREVRFPPRFEVKSPHEAA